MTNDVVRIKHGLRLRKPRAYFGFFGTIFFTVIFGVAFLKEEGPDWDSQLIVFLFLSFFFGLFWETSGVEIRLKSRQVRFYTWQYGYTRGVWLSLDDFERFELSIDRYNIRQVSFPNMERKIEHNKSFFIWLVPRVIGGETILINEFLDYRKARKALHTLSKKTGFKEVDYFAEELRQAKEKRAQRGMR